MDAARARLLGYQSAGEVAELLGVTPRTVRYYEEQGLVAPVRTDKGTRYYSDFVVQRLEVCVRLAAIGVPIRTLSQLATIRTSSAAGSVTSRRLTAVFAQLREDLRGILANVRYLLSDLAFILHLTWDDHRPEPTEPHLARVVRIAAGAVVDGIEPVGRR